MPREVKGGTDSSCSDHARAEADALRRDINNWYYATSHRFIPNAGLSDNSLRDVLYRMS